jgi:hypothetical protein
MTYVSKWSGMLGMYRLPMVRRQAVLMDHLL